MQFFFGSSFLSVERSNGRNINRSEYKSSKNITIETSNGCITQVRIQSYKNITVERRNGRNTHRSEYKAI